MAISINLKNKHKNEIEKDVYNCCINALQIIPSILATNTGICDTIDILKRLEIALEKGNLHYGMNGITGEIMDMKELVMEPIRVKSQCLKSVFEAVMQLIRVDGIIETKTK